MFRELGLPSYFDTADGEHQLSSFIKKGYRQGDHRGTGQYNATYHNRTMVTDHLMADMSVLGEPGRLSVHGMSCGQEALQSKTNVISSGKNVFKLPLFILGLHGDDLEEAIQQMSCDRESLLDILETEGIEHLRARLGIFLYKAENGGRDPPIGLGGQLHALPMPKDGFVVLCTTLAVYPGRVAGYRRGLTDVMPVRVGEFYGRKWKCDVQIDGEEAVNGEFVPKTWYARVLLLMR